MVALRGLFVMGDSAMHGFAFFVDGFKIDFSAFKNKGTAAVKKSAPESSEEPRDEAAEEHARTVQVFKTWDTQKKMRIMRLNIIAT